jgi:hypothetical protein
MRHTIKTLVVVLVVLFAAISYAQEGDVILERSIQLPRDADFGGQTLSRGAYRIALTDINGEKWFIIKKAGKEVARDIAIEMPAADIPTQGLKAEILKGDEYYRVRVRQGDKVYLIHFLLKGGKA